MLASIFVIGISAWYILKKRNIVFARKSIVVAAIFGFLSSVYTVTTGEPDVLKSLQLLPGVQTAGEGSANLNVRGGSFDQNLIILDEVPVYNPSHALGFFSTFNTDALNNVSFPDGTVMPDKH